MFLVLNIDKIHQVTVNSAADPGIQQLPKEISYQPQYTDYSPEVKPYMFLL
jgi:hypothetical protein